MCIAYYLYLYWFESFGIIEPKNGKMVQVSENNRNNN